MYFLKKHIFENYKGNYREFRIVAGCVLVFDMGVPHISATPNVIWKVALVHELCVMNYAAKVNASRSAIGLRDFAQVPARH